jgi:hypothetical protein
MTCDDLENSLRTLPLRDPVIRVGGTPRRLLAVVSSPDFETMPEAERQAMVWGHLLDAHGIYVDREVEFVFTLTPQMLAEGDRREQQLQAG